jgi:hypothetical protein
MARRLLAVAATAGVAIALFSACATNTTTDDAGAGNSSSGGATSSSGASTGNSSGGNASSSGSSSGSKPGGSSGGSSSGNSNSSSSGAGGSSTGGSSGGGNGGSSSGGTASSSSGAGGSSSGGTASSSSGVGGSSSGSSADGGLDCTNTNMSVINIDSSGWACNNQWAIQGAWYCYADTAGSSNCGGTGFVPYNPTSNAMCISGMTSTSTAGATAFGAGLGLVLNEAMHNAPKSPFNASTRPNNQPAIVGFAITVSGDSGGSALNINLPPALTGSGEAPAVTVPAISAANSPITYNILINDAIISDNTTAPIPKISPANLTDVQVAIPGADGIAHSYNFCITKIVPLTAAVSAPGALATYGAQFNEGKQIVIEALNGYGVQNDPFGLGNAASMPMTVSYGGGKVGFTASPQFNTAGTNTPGAFPSIISGWVHGGNIIAANSGGYAGTTTIGTMMSAVSNWSFTTPSGGSWDAAYDVWLAQNPAPINAGFELMVWVDSSTVHPIGFNGTGPAFTTGGVTYNIYTGTNGTGQPVITYLAGATNATSMNLTNFDLKPFFTDATSRGLAAGDVVLSVQAGFEVYQQNGTPFTTSSYSIAIR